MFANLKRRARFFVLAVKILCIEEEEEEEGNTKIDGGE
jgi:hypothetical protein